MEGEIQITQSGNSLGCLGQKADPAFCHPIRPTEPYNTRSPFTSTLCLAYRFWRVRKAIRITAPPPYVFCLEARSRHSPPTACLSDQKRKHYTRPSTSHSPYAAAHGSMLIA